MTDFNKKYKRHRTNPLRKPVLAGLLLLKHQQEPSDRPAQHSLVQEILSDQPHQQSSLQAKVKLRQEVQLAQQPFRPEQ